jgi:hypothetical protein
MKRLAILSALVVVLTAGLAGAATTYNVTTDAAVRKTVLVIGDSNAVLGSAALSQAFTNRPNGYVSILTPRSGMGIRGYFADNPPSADYWQVRLPQVLAAVQPDVILIELGVNDTDRPGTATTTGYANYGQKINWLLDLLPAGVPVLWSNLPCALEPVARRTGCAAVNWALALAQSRLTLINWSAAASGHPGYFIPGQVHLTDAGYTAYAVTVVRALDALP